jgi:hypothetical protein
MTAKRKSIAAQAKAKGLKPSLVYNRLSLGWTMEKALNTPVSERHRPKKPNVKYVEEYRSSEPSNDENFNDVKKENAMLWVFFWGLLVACAFLALHSISGT